MKVIWEAADVRAGIRVRKPGCIEVWIIGYDPAVHGRATPAFAIVSLADGMISIKHRSAEEIAGFLNETGHQPVALIGEIEPSTKARIVYDHGTDQTIRAEET